MRTISGGCANEAQLLGVLLDVLDVVAGAVDVDAVEVLDEPESVELADVELLDELDVDDELEELEPRLSVL